MKAFKKIFIPLILVLAIVSGIVFANQAYKNETAEASKPLSLNTHEAKQAAIKKWEATPEAKRFKAWENSSAGKKVQASYAKIKQQIKAFSDMEARVTSVSFQRPNTKSAGPKWLIVSIDGEQYMIQFVPKDFQALSNLKVNDKITIRSRSAGYSHNHPYLILSGDFIAKGNQVLFERDLSKNNGC